jgi:SAM-dependent methyltransferase
MPRSYDDQVREQIEQYRDTEDMQALPASFHLWSPEFILPGMERVFGVGDINLFYVSAFIAAARHNPEVPAFASMGCGDGVVEIGIAGTLRQRGIKRFRFVCYDLSEILLDRFRAAIPPDLVESFELVAGDLNNKIIDTKFDAIMANHSLHHMVDLEGIFNSIHENLTEHGIFVTNDMIGRNGHMRWPETRLFVEYFWPFLSMRQRHNVLLRRVEHGFIDHDCSDVGFEGIRSQDVLPLILARGFHAWKFMGFGGMIDVFVDRCFGPNFDTTDPDDRFLLHHMSVLNDILLDSGLTKPTIMLAWFVKYPVEEICYRDRSAGASIRNSAEAPAWLPHALSDFRRLPADPGYVFKSHEKLLDFPGARSSPEADAELHELTAALRDARNDAAIAQTLAAEQERRIRNLELSTSWRLTAPLRGLARMIRR